MGFTGNIDHAAKLKESVENWYNEIKHSEQSYINKFPSKYIIGNFTAMMVDKNVRLGCAAITYTPPKGKTLNYLATSDYATTNMIDFPIYTSCDKPAAKSTSGTNPKYPNLLKNMNFKYILYSKK